MQEIIGLWPNIYTPPPYQVATSVGWCAYKEGIYFVPVAGGHHVKLSHYTISASQNTHSPYW